MVQASRPRMSAAFARQKPTDRGRDPRPGKRQADACPTIRCKGSIMVHQMRSKPFVAQLGFSFAVQAATCKVEVWTGRIMERGKPTKNRHSRTSILFGIRRATPGWFRMPPGTKTFTSRGQEFCASLHRWSRMPDSVRLQQGRGTKTFRQFPRSRNESGPFPLAEIPRLVSPEN